MTKWSGELESVKPSYVSGEGWSVWWIMKDATLE